ncbi:hypothetical protein BMR1_02g02991 [Babesia microti strain RI]|uniref:Uncharacterized protein n=1 Tax=Babesia microti (strain RI) TaxID=1133968 RepID=A0A1R4AAS6_BABMR|nr:hypothetical protein BMR1_02g02991 [Babesia microti strain RI]SJK86064.1 hypothetical protein BMR1_02g02991 [Babesia microti strain RI]|eukprot:XP_012648361.2 hypothetical protein BMR1_02g02991 [Babesia microti strain RI]
METRGLKTLFAGGVSSTIPLVTLQATLYLVGPILGHDILDSEEFFETMTWVVNVGMMAGSLVAVLYIDKSATCYYYLTFISAMGCHSLVFLTIRPNDEFLWLVLGVSMGTFSTICQYKVILRAAIYEKKDYALGLIPLAIAGITFGNLLGIGIQYYVLKRFPLSNTVDEKMFLIYVWIFTITVMILSVKFYTDIAVEIDHGGISMNNDRSISIFNHYDSFKSGFKSFKLVINPLFLYLTCLTLESFFIPGSG